MSTEFQGHWPQSRAIVRDHIKRRPKPSKESSIRLARIADLVSATSWVENNTEMQNWAGLEMRFPPDTSRIESYWKNLKYSTIPIAYEYLDERVGYAELDLSDLSFGSCRLGKFIVGPSTYRGKGNGRRFLKDIEQLLFRELSFVRFDLLVITRNAVARDLYTSQGYLTEGILKNARYYDGLFFDMELRAKLNSYFLTATVKSSGPLEPTS